MRAIAEEVGLPLVLPEFIPRSRRALEASEHARARGRHEAFHRAVFHRYFGQGRDISDWAVLREAAVEAGLDPDEMQAETESGRYRTVVDKQHARALSMGISGVPTFIFDERFAVVGAQPYEVFRRVMERLQEEG